MALAGLVLLVTSRRRAEFWLGVVTGAAVSSVFGLVLLFQAVRPRVYDESDHPAQFTCFAFLAAAAVPLLAVWVSRVRAFGTDGGWFFPRQLEADPPATPSLNRKRRGWARLGRVAVVGVGVGGAVATVALIYFLTQRYAYDPLHLDAFDSYGLVAPEVRRWTWSYAALAASAVAVAGVWAVLRQRRFAAGLLGGWAASLLGLWQATFDVVEAFRAEHAVRPGAGNDFSAELSATWVFGASLIVLLAVAVGFVAAGTVARLPLPTRRAFAAAGADRLGSVGVAAPTTAAAGQPDSRHARQPQWRHVAVAAVCLLVATTAVAAGKAVRSAPDVGSHPYDVRLALSPDERKLYVGEAQITIDETFEHTSFRAGRVAVVDTATATFVGSPVTIPDRPELGAPGRVEVATSPDGADVHVVAHPADADPFVYDFDGPDVTGPARATSLSEICRGRPASPGSVPPGDVDETRRSTAGALGGLCRADAAPDAANWGAARSDRLSVTSPDGRTGYSVRAVDESDRPFQLVYTDLATGKALPRPPLRVPPVDAMTPSPDGRHLFVLSGPWRTSANVVEVGWLWKVDVETGLLVGGLEIRAGLRQAWHVTTSTDGSRVVLDDERSITVVDAADLAPVGEPVAVGDGLEFVLVNRDGFRVYAADRNQTVYVVDATRPAVVATIEVNTR